MWIIYSLIAAFSRTIKDIGYKIILKDSDLWTSAFSIWVVTLIVLIPISIVIWRKSKKHLRTTNQKRYAIWGALSCGILNFIAYALFVYSLKNGDFSIVVPLRNLVPVFALFLGAFILKEKVGLKVISAVMIVFIGIIIIHISSETFSLKALFNSITDKASLAAFLCALVFSLTILTTKYGTGKEYGNMNSVIFITYVIAVMSLCFLLLIAIQGNLPIIAELFKNHTQSLIFVGVLGAIGSASTTAAIKVGETIKVAPMLRVHALLSVVIGGLFFHESNLPIRIIGCLILTVGLIWIVFIKEKK